MATVTVTVFVHHLINDPDGYYVTGYDASQFGNSVLIGKYELEVQEPSKSDRTKACIAALEDKIATIHAGAYKEVSGIKETIKKLLCIEEMKQSSFDDDGIPF
jgi:hypothetical protein